MSYFPFFVEIEEKNWLLAGGGKVSLRKAGVLLGCGARVTVVSPQMDEGFFSLKRECGKMLTLIRREFQDSDLDHQDFAIAATSNRSLNARIGEQCRERGIPVNVADRGAECSFLFPALVQRGPVTVGISTGGNSPLIARFARDQIRKCLPEDLGDISRQLGELRGEVKALFPQNPDCRREAFEALAQTAMKKGKPLNCQEIQDAVRNCDAKYNSREMGRHES